MFSAAADIRRPACQVPFKDKNLIFRAVVLVLLSHKLHSVNDDL